MTDAWLMVGVLKEVILTQKYILEDVSGHVSPTDKNT